MSTTLTKGYKKPQTGDFGSSFFPDLEFDIQRLNDHTHDGVNSAQLGPQASVALLQAVGTSWTLSGGLGGDYFQDVTIPVILTNAGLTFDTLGISLRQTSGSILLLTCTKQSSTVFRIYSNDITLDVSVVYTT